MCRSQSVARSWTSAEEECRAGGGHLASLGHTLDTETLILTTVTVSDWWTGANICPDSPGIIRVAFMRAETPTQSYQNNL